MIRKLMILCLAVFVAAAGFGDAKFGITGVVEWDTLEIKAAVSLDLASAGIRLPAGRTQGEMLVTNEYLRLIRPGIMNLQVDSSSTIADLLERGELSLYETEYLALQARAIAPALSPDLASMSAAYTLDLGNIGAALLRHNRPSEVMRTLTPVPTTDYTGIIIIAAENLPIHGMQSRALPVPCLFPKIWDTDMNLIFERNMLEVKNTAMVRYAPADSIFQDNPSGLSDDLRAVVGDRPLRIFARGIFGINPTDPVIDREDALLIISSRENRRLLSDGKVVVILDDSVLRSDLTGN